MYIYRGTGYGVYTPFFTQTYWVSYKKKGACGAGSNSLESQAWAV